MGKIKKLTIEELNQIIEENVRKINNVCEEPPSQGFNITMETVQFVPNSYKNTYFMFFATKPEGNIVQLLFSVAYIKKKTYRQVMLNGDMLFGNEWFNGNIYVDLHNPEEIKPFFKRKNVKYSLVPDNRTLEQWKKLLDEFNQIYYAIDIPKKVLLSPEIHNELKSYIDNYSTKASTGSYIWNPDKNFNIYVEPYEDGYGVYLGNCLKYCVSDKDIANRICEILQKDVSNLVICRGYPRRPKPEDECF